ncbi:MAG: c-type cytochrome [Roseibacillus sp.]|nr:c-type cytochrome [Roseibacillus sp.]
MLSKSQARTFFLGGTGVFTAAFLALTVDSMRQVPALTKAENLTEEVVAGKGIWESNNCMGCHTLFGEGAYYGPELTKVVERRGKPWLRLFLKDPQKMFPGERKMVNYDFNEEQIEHVISFLEWCGEVELNGFPAKPPLGRVTVPTTAGPSGVQQPEMFKTICIACHAVGGVGGKVGPTLDNVGGKMDREAFKAWISDPQKIKPGTAMPKIPMTPEQLEEVIDYLLRLSPEK